MLAYERLVESSRVVRDLTAKLRQDRGVAASNLVAICGLERELAEDFGRRGKYSESRALLMDAMELLEGRRSGAPMTRMSSRRTRGLSGISGGSPGTQQRYDEALVWLRRAEEVLEGLAHEPQDLEVILSIDDVRRAIAGLFGRRGQDESRRRLLESHIRMLERLSERAGGDPAIGLLAALARVRSGPRSERERQDPRARWRDFRQIDGSRDGWRRNWRCGLPATSSRIRPTRSPPANRRGAWTRTSTPVRSSWRSNQDVRRWAVYPALFPAAAMQVCGIAVGRAAEQRKAGRLDDARWTAASLFAFGKMLARRDPNEAAFHVVLCEAFEQEAKNAWKVKDFPTIEAATRNALVAASTALRLDPRNTAAQMKVAGLQDKIVGLASRRPAAAMSSRLQAERLSREVIVGCPVSTDPGFVGEVGARRAPFETEDAASAFPRPKATGGTT